MRRPSQRRRLLVDRKTFDFYHDFLGYPKVTVAEVAGFALGGGFELALMADISVVARDTMIGMPATRFLGPALGSLHMFFYRLGPMLARRLLLTGDTIEAGEVAHLGVFTEVVEAMPWRPGRPGGPRRPSRMPADGIVIAKEAFRLVEQLQGYQGEEVPATCSTPSAPTCSSTTASSTSSRSAPSTARSGPSSCATTTSRSPSSRSLPSSQESVRSGHGWVSA